MAKPIYNFRYACHGCFKIAGYYEKPVENARVVCPHCGKDQTTKLENFIQLTDEEKASL